MKYTVVLSIINGIYIHECFKIEFVSEFSYLSKT